MSDFVHLHTHCEYSLLDGLARMEDLIAQAKKLKFDSLALTDHGAMYGAIRFYQEAKASGIKPIIGVEAYMATRSRLDKQPGIDKDQFHLVLLAKNNQGYKNLLKLVSVANLEGYYYKPRLDIDILKEHSQGLICLSGCLAGELSTLIINRQEQAARKKAKELAQIFGEDHFYLELQSHPKIPDQEYVNQKLVTLSRGLGIPLVATNDIHYLTAADAQAHEILLCVQTQRTMLESNRPLSLEESPDFYMKSATEMKQAFAQYPDAIANTRKIADMCEVELNLGRWILPPFSMPGGKKPEHYLKEQVEDGVKRLYGTPIPKLVSKRLESEMSIIVSKGYMTYFLIVADFVTWAKERGIFVGPGRGSAAGSVVSYCLGITGIDPFYFDLPFERFLNPMRPSPPDIDLDFADERRDEVIAYVTEKYGADKVAQIITFGTMEARQAVRDTGRALGMPYSKPDRIAKMIPIGAQGFAMTIDKALSLSADLRLAYEKEEDTKRLLDLSQKLEGVARHHSIHAAGVVIADKPLVEYTPLQREAKGNKIVTQYDMYTIGEDGVGLLKMDFLGLRNLTIIEKTLAFVKERKGEDIDINAIPLDDVPTYELLSSGETTGIFQLESRGMRRYIKELKPTSVFDLMAMVALYRPGPMAVIPEFIKRKHNPDSIVYPDPRLKPVLAKSYGIITYQDDVLLTALTLAGYSWGEADKLRKAVGKKIPSEMKKQEEKFIKGCIKNGLSQKKAYDIFHLIEPFAGYGFNKAHAACYAMIAYQTAYLKTHYTPEFMTAVLTCESRAVSGPQREEKLGILVEECKRMGIELVGPDVNESATEFTIEGSTSQPQIRFGLSVVKNVGTKAIEVILRARRRGGPFNSFREFVSRVDLTKVNKKTLESLIKTGAFDRFSKRAHLLSTLTQTVTEAQKEKKIRERGQIGLFDLGATSTTDKPKKTKIEEFSKAELLKFERELLGFYLTEHPLTPKLAEIENSVSHSIGDIGEADVGTTVVIGGIIQRYKKITTRKNNHEMAFVRLSDLTGSIELVVFPKLYKKFKPLLILDQVILIKGRVDEKDNRSTIIVNDIFT